MWVRTLVDRLKNKEFRSHFVSAQVRRLVTAQIKALRESKRWTQAELGKRAGMKPNAVSRLENPDYGDFTVNTLLRLARAFDVGLIVRFAPFSDLVIWNRSVTPASYTPPSFDKDESLSPPPALAQKPVRFYRSAKLISPVPKFKEVPPSNLDYWSLAGQPIQNVSNPTTGQGQYVN